MLETVSGPVPTMKTEEWKRFEGQRVKPNLILRQCVGSSANTAVFSAETSNNEVVAVKLVLAAPEDATALLARWNAASKLSHPHLIRIAEFGRCRLGTTEFIFVVTEYAEENLGQVLPQRALTPEETREMLGPVVDVLTYIHDEGFAHGRLKPANILAVHDVLKLSSDGIVREGEAQLLPASESAYDAPESSTKSTAAGDMWALGLVVAQALNHQAPVSGTSKSKSNLAEGLPAPFNGIARDCLNPDPARRCSAADIARRLGRSVPQKSSSPAQPKPEAALPAIKPAAIVETRTPETKSTANKSEAPQEAKKAEPILVAKKIESNSNGKKPEAQLPRPQVPEAPTAAETPRSSSSRTYSIIAVVVVLAVLAAWWFSRSKSTPESGQSAATSTQAPAAAQTTAAQNQTAPVAPAQSAPAAPSTAANGVVHQVDPDVSQGALRTIHGIIKVRVRVNVDGSGSVKSANFLVHGSSQYFARQAMDAAKQWKFAPDNQAARRQWTLTFEFRKSGAKVLSAERT